MSYKTKNVYNSNIGLIIFMVIMLSFILTFLFSCSNKKNISDTNNNVEESTIWMPVAVNDKAMIKSMEVETNEETKAHHIYDYIDLKPDSEIIIGEKQFLTKIHYINNNVDAFKNSMIEVEGMYGWYDSWDKTFSFPMVYRNGPSCCGDDQYGGFFLVNFDENQYTLDDWLVVRGVPFMYEHTDSEGEIQNYLFLLVDSVTTLPTKSRGMEMVND